MTKEEILELLKDRDVNPTMIAKSLNVTPQAVHKVINEGHGSIRIVKAVATVCGVDHKSLFPYYLREKETTARKKREQRQKELDKKLAKLA